MVRPRKEINWDVVERRMEAGNSATVIAQYHHIDIDTFYRRFKEEYGCSFGDYTVLYKECGKGNVAFMQYTKAMQGNANMLTLLGREWLGQGKIMDQESPHQDSIDLKHENMMLRAELQDIKEKMRAN